jgi:hypothetical protein
LNVASVGAVCSIVAVLAASPGSAFAKGGGGPSMGGFHASSPSMSSGFSGVSKGVNNVQLSKGIGTLPLNKNIGKFPITKIGGNTPIGKNVGNLPITKNLGKLPLIKNGGPISPAIKSGKFNFCCPIDPCFCHHDFCCNPCWNWSYPWLLPVFVEEVACVQTIYSEPLYTLFYETADGIKVYSRYELPTESATLYKNEHLLDKANTAWWLVSTTGELVDTNTAEKVVSVSTAVESE